MNNHLPVYKSKATPEENETNLKWYAKQVQLIIDQEEIDVPSKFTKIRCGCNKLVGWKYMYRCIWFCRDCAERHFGYRVPSSHPGYAAHMMMRWNESQNPLLPQPQLRKRRNRTRRKPKLRPRR